MLNHLKPFNFILACDGYKCNHWEEIPENIDYGYVVMVPRTVSKYSDKIVAMGMTLLASVLASVRITEEMIDEAEIEITQQGYSFNRKGWERIARDFNGKLPLALYGVEEGRIVNPQTPVAALTNTMPGFAWLPTFAETFSLSLVWKMSTVASICRAVRMSMIEFCKLTGTDTSAVDFMLHNFGDRGADSPHEAAVIAGIAHAAIFDSSDCVRANGYIKKLYRTTKPSTSSIEATEHSVMCAHSDPETRDDWGAALMAVDRLYACVERSKQGIGLPFMSVVIDTYDSRRFVQDYMGTKLKDKIIASGGRMVMRPDSGNPEIEPGLVGLDLVNTFGCTTRDVDGETYLVLHDAVGVIQGDGIRIDTFMGVLQGWLDAGFAMDNFCLGMGSGVTHDGARDDFSWSMKSTANCINGKWHAELKDPKSDSGKKSLTGLVCCREDSNGNLEVYDALHEGNLYSMWTPTPGWRKYFADGYKDYIPTWDSVKERARY